MRKTNTPAKNIGQYAGKWIVIDPIKDKIIAVGETLKEIEPLITRPVSDKRPSGTVPAALKVPYKNEGPYVLLIL